MNACCGECLHEEQRRHVAILWFAIVVAIAVVTGLLVGGSIMSLANF
jgi:predicted nucleic acid-binding Zn ribbon protein